MLRKLIVGVLSLIYVNLAYALTLEQAIAVQVKKGIAYLNLESEREYTRSDEDDEPYKYELGSKKVIKSDVNGDGILDAVVLVQYCEILACHITTGSLDFMVFLGQKNNQYKHVASKGVGISAEIKALPKGIIEVTSYSYRNSDSMCCPSKKSITRYKYVNGNLNKSK